MTRLWKSRVNGVKKLWGFQMNREFRQLLRSILFVPGTRPDRFDKAVASGADVVCVDLEDAVADKDKSHARSLVAPFFNAPREGKALRSLRINQLASENGLRDMLTLLEMDSSPDLVLLPKVESAQEIAWFRSVMNSRYPALNIVALIETPEGLNNAADIARSEGVVAIVFGSADYSAEVGCDMSWEALQYGRGCIIQAAAMAGVQAIDGAWLNLDDNEGLLEETRRVSALGFVGRPALHPRQVAWIHKGLSPDEEALSQARRIVEAYRANRGGVLSVDGRMVDAPVVERALRMVEASERA